MKTVTRQIQWPCGEHIVEITHGGIDYTNPDALVEKYPGEFQEYENPVEAVEAAIKIAIAWQKDCRETIMIDMGCTHGMTLIFDGKPLTDETFKELRDIAQKELEQLPKCDRCGELLPNKYIFLSEFGDEFKFCREYCADKFAGDMYEENQVELNG